jgi:hypothetical protein
VSSFWIVVMVAVILAMLGAIVGLRRMRDRQAARLHRYEQIFGNAKVRSLLEENGLADLGPVVEGPAGSAGERSSAVVDLSGAGRDTSFPESEEKFEGSHRLSLRMETLGVPVMDAEDVVLQPGTEGLARLTARTDALGSNGSAKRPESGSIAV